MAEIEEKKEEKVVPKKNDKPDVNKFIERKLRVINQIPNKALAARLAAKVLANRKA